MKFKLLLVILLYSTSLIGRFDFAYEAMGNYDQSCKKGSLGACAMFDMILENTLCKKGNQRVCFAFKMKIRNAQIKCNNGDKYSCAYLEGDALKMDSINRKANNKRKKEALSRLSKGKGLYADVGVGLKNAKSGTDTAGLVRIGYGLFGTTFVYINIDFHNMKYLKEKSKLAGGGLGLDYYINNNFYIGANANTGTITSESQEISKGNYIGVNLGYTFDKPLLREYQQSVELSYRLFNMKPSNIRFSEDDIDKNSISIVYKVKASPKPK